MYGGAVATNDKNFYLFANEFLKKFGNFPHKKYIKQCLTYLILKIFSIKIIYKYTFFKCLQKAHLSKNLFFLSIVYPSLKFKKQALPKFYSTKINNLSIKMIYLQLNDIKNFNKNHLAKKNNNLYYQKIFSEEKIDGILLLKYVDATRRNNPSSFCQDITLRNAQDGSIPARLHVFVNLQPVLQALKVQQ